MTDTFTDPSAGLRAATFPYGRLTVAAGQTISSAWGNTTFDQTMQVFASASDRTNQWPSPNEGAQSWLMDSHTPWVFRAGAWHALPMGYVASILGPATAVSLTGGTTIVSLANIALVAGRRYRLSAYSQTSQTTVGTGSYYHYVAMTETAGFGINNYRLYTAPGLAAGFFGSGSLVRSFVPAASGNYTLTMTGTISGGGGASAGVNSSELLLEDIGS